MLILLLLRYLFWVPFSSYSHVIFHSYTCRNVSACDCKQIWALFLYNILEDILLPLVAPVRFTMPCHAPSLFTVMV